MQLASRATITKATVIRYRPGSRVYFGQVGSIIVLLLCGGDTRFLFSGLSVKPLGQLLIDISTVTDSHQANGVRFLFNGVDDAKAADAVLS